MDKSVLDRNKPLVNTPSLWKPFEELLQERLSSLRILLEKSSETHQIYRLQGEIANVKWFLGLREKVNG